MKTEIINGDKLKVYNSIDEIPIERLHKFNKMLLIDSCVGSNIEDISVHIEKAKRLIKEKPESAVIELNNLHVLLHLINEEVNAKHLSFFCLVSEINGKPMNDISEENLNYLLNKYGNVRVGWLRKKIDALKKKIDEELSLYFPNQFESGNTKEHYDNIKRITLLILDEVINEKDNEKDIDNIRTLILIASKPSNFLGKDNAEIEYDKNFDKMCVLLNQELNLNAKSITAREFYSALEYLEKRSEEQKKQNRNGR